MEKTMEMKIYEKLGIKNFKNIICNLGYLGFSSLPDLVFKKNRQNFINQVKSTCEMGRTNYTIGTTNNLEDIKSFKKMTLLNGGIHLFNLIACIAVLIAIGNTVYMIIPILLSILDIYCIMLQRYNTIRINQTMKKFKPHYERKKNQMKEELIKKDSLLAEHTYKIINVKVKKELDTTIEDLLSTATYDQLLEYKGYLDYCQNIDQEIKESNNYLEDIPMIKSLPLEPKGFKRLKIEFKENQR